MAQKFWTAEDLAAAGYSAGQPEVFEITDAAVRQSVAVGSRARSYALKMLLRLVCVIAAVCVDGLWQWIFLLGAVLLPWTAVVVANGEDRQGSGGFSAPEPLALGPSSGEGFSARSAGAAEGTEATGATRSAEGGDDQDLLVLEGEIVEESDIDGR